MNPFQTKPPRPLFWIALSAVCGIAIADRWVQPLFPTLGAFTAFAIIASIFPKAWIGLLLAACGFGTLHTLRHHHGEAMALWHQSVQPSVVEARGLVVDEPRAFQTGRGEKRASFRLQLERLSGEAGVIALGAHCLIHWAGEAPGVGDRVALTGSLRRIAATANPAEFDTANWLRRSGIGVEIRVDSAASCLVMERAVGAPLLRLGMAARDWICSQLVRGLVAPEEQSLIQSMVLGLRGETPEEMKELFQKTGTLHLFAVSGLNVAMLAAIVWCLLQPFHISQRVAFFIILPVLIAYAVVTGLSTSCVRATVMAATVLAAPLFQRPAVPMNSLGAAALAILAWDTNELFSPGFQLSFVLVICILSLAGTIASRMERIAHPDEWIPRKLWTRAEIYRVNAWRVICASFGVTIAAWLGSLLFMAGYFHLISPVALLANAVAVPLAFCVLALGLMALLCSLHTASIVLVNHANWLCAKALLWSMALCAKVPGGYLYVEWPRLEETPLCEVTALYVGEGSAIHIRAGGQDWMIDAGHKHDYALIVLPYLRSRGINRLDGLILTHGDSAHVGGAAPLVKDFAPRVVWAAPEPSRSPTRRSALETIDAAGIPLLLAERNTRIVIDEKTSLRVLFPPAGWKRTRADDRAAVLALECEERRILLTSDAGFSTERWLQTHADHLPASLLIRGWHTQDFSGTADFIAATRAKHIVSSAPPFGMKAVDFETWRSLLMERSLHLWNQSEIGAVRVRIIRGQNMTLQTWRRSIVAIADETP